MVLLDLTLVRVLALVLGLWKTGSCLLNRKWGCIITIQSGSSIKKQIIDVEGQVEVLGARSDFVLQGGCQCSHLYFSHEIPSRSNNFFRMCSLSCSRRGPVESVRRARILSLISRAETPSVLSLDIFSTM